MNLCTTPSARFSIYIFMYVPICPKSCALCDIHSCSCSTQEACADIIISDLNMPFMKGLNFFEQQIKKGCKVKHLAMMSGDIAENDSDRSIKLGIKLFQRPFKLNKLADWVKIVENEIPENRLLTNWDFVDKR